MPIYLHAYKKIDHPYIWPYQYIFKYKDSQKKPEPRQEIVKVYETDEGKQIKAEVVKKVTDAAYDALSQARKDWSVAEVLWSEGTPEGRLEALIKYKTIRLELGKTIAILEATNLQPYRKAKKTIDQFSSAKLTQGAQWLKGMTQPEAAALRKKMAEKLAAEKAAEDAPKEDAAPPAKQKKEKEEEW